MHCFLEDILTAITKNDAFLIDLVQLAHVNGKIAVVALLESAGVVEQHFLVGVVQHLETSWSGAVTVLVAVEKNWFWLTHENPHKACLPAKASFEKKEPDPLIQR